MLSLDMSDDATLDGEKLYINVICFIFEFSPLYIVYLLFVYHIDVASVVTCSDSLSRSNVRFRDLLSL